MACLTRRLFACSVTMRRYVAQISSVRNLKVSSSFHHNTNADITRKTVGEIEEDLKMTFKHNNIADAEESANFIVAHALGHKTLFSIQKQQILSERHLKDINRMTVQRLKHMPVQYVLNEWDFKDITLTMKPPVFIPRPETEELIDLMCSDQNVSSANHFIEIGPGSGAICLSLLNQYPNLHCTAFEAGTEAVNLTRTNAVSLRLASRLELHHLPLTESSMETIDKLLGESIVDFIVSNPPYILTEDMQGLQKEITLYEDHRALDGGVDGLDVIRCVMLLAQKVLKPGGSVWLETDSSHPSQIEELAHSYNLAYCKTIKDFGNHDRFCHLTRK